MNATSINTFIPGPIALFGSGETTPSGRKIFEALFNVVKANHASHSTSLNQLASPRPLNVAILETPAGFELNSAQVAKRVGDFIGHHLQNYNPQTQIIPARKRDTPESPDNPHIAAPLLQADVIFMGPGSPTYAVRQLRDSLTWHYLLARHRLGAALALSSAATIAISTYALPVYEIYKVGEDLHWIEGLDLFRFFGLRLVFIPHWNNSDGGEELDTSRCYMGRSRFDRLMELLPPEVMVIGIDEKTGLLFDFNSQQCRVVGKGTVTILDKQHQRQFKPGQSFPFNELGDLRNPQPDEALPPERWQQVWLTYLQHQQNRLREPKPPENVLQIVEIREMARRQKDWQRADELRQHLATLGWQVSDTSEGPRLTPIRT